MFWRTGTRVSTKAESRTESYSKAELDQYVAALASVVEEAERDPDTVRSAPHRAPIHRVRAEDDALNDPRRWAVTPRLLDTAFATPL